MCVRKYEELLKCVQRSRDSRLDLEGGSWLQVARLMHTCQACQKLKCHASYSLQDKSSRLARPFARGLNSWLNPVARSSRQNTLFGKIWRFTFLLTLLYIYPYTHDSERASRENFKRETLEKTRLTHPQSLSKRLFKFSTLSLSIVKSLRGSLPKPFLTISREAHYQNLFSPYPFLWKGCLVFWEAVRKEPISYWLMLWSSSEIWEARKEIGSA